MSSVWFQKDDDTEFIFKIHLISIRYLKFFTNIFRQSLFFTWFFKKMFHRRNLLQCVLLFGILFQSSLYLWTKRGEIHPESGQLPAHPLKKIPHKNALEFDSSFESTTDSKSASPCGDIIEWHISNKSRIEPFPKFKVSAKNFAVDRDMLRTYDWWDLWKGDPNCTRYQVHLLKQGSQSQPGAFVSFPGSGNSWIRSLLMGITGIYVTSVYTDEARYFRPEGKSN